MENKPWTVTERFPNAFDVGPDIAWIGQCRLEGENKKLAHLIAAAPELLAHLQISTMLIQSVISSSLHPQARDVISYGFMQILKSRVKENESLIKKAKGEL